jgi:hypothetical protein
VSVGPGKTPVPGTLRESATSPSHTVLRSLLPVSKLSSKFSFSTCDSLQSFSVSSSIFLDSGCPDCWVSESVANDLFSPYPSPLPAHFAGLTEVAGYVEKDCVVHVLLGTTSGELIPLSFTAGVIKDGLFPAPLVMGLSLYHKLGIAHAPDGSVQFQNVLRQPCLLSIYDRQPFPALHSRGESHRLRSPASPNLFPTRSSRVKFKRAPAVIPVTGIASVNTRPSSGPIDYNPTWATRFGKSTLFYSFRPSTISKSKARSSSGPAPETRPAPKHGSSVKPPLRRFHSPRKKPSSTRAQPPDSVRPASSSSISSSASTSTSPSVSPSSASAPGPAQETQRPAPASSSSTPITNPSSEVPTPPPLPQDAQAGSEAERPRLCMNSVSRSADLPSLPKDSSAVPNAAYWKDNDHVPIRGLPCSIAVDPYAQKNSYEPTPFCIVYESRNTNPTTSSDGTAPVGFRMVMPFKVETSTSRLPPDFQVMIRDLHSKFPELFDPRVNCGFSNGDAF